MKINCPIIVFGTGRCGSTVFHRLLTTHPNLAWLSRWMDSYPEKPKRNRLIMKALDYPVLSKLVRNRVNPGECYNFWEHHIKGFRRPCRDLTDDDVMKHHHKISTLLAKTMTKKRNRLLLKITGWPRVKFLKELFPNAKFIHVYRDGRAVTASNLKVGFWNGWEGPRNWRWGELSEVYKEEWVKHEKAFIALGGIQWKILMDAAEKATRDLNEDNFMEVKYENLCKDHLSVMKDVLSFCELEWTRSFEKSIKRFSLENTNYKWKQDFSEKQQDILNSVLESNLSRYGYVQ